MATLMIKASKMLPLFYGLAGFCKQKTAQIQAPQLSLATLSNENLIVIIPYAFGEYSITRYNRHSES
jgi:hypothetical protein